MKGRVLIIAGSDSGGGAGIQADIKTVTALGGYAATALTALTAQDTERVHAILPVPPDFVRRQMDAVLGDIGADCIKTGMLHDSGVIEAVAAGLEERARGVPLVVDPVLVATSGARLLAMDAIEALKRLLITRAQVVTPNLLEAEALVGGSIATPAAMREAALALRGLGAAAVVVKGGHLAGDRLCDVALDAEGDFVLEAPRIVTRSTHGTGCTLASAIAVGLAQGLGFRAAFKRAHAYVQAAIRAAPGLGRGHGPLNHSHAIGETSH